MQTFYGTIFVIVKNFFAVDCAKHSKKAARQVNPSYEIGSYAIKKIV